MKKYKSEWIAFTKDRELIVFDSEIEARKELKNNREKYTRIYGSARWMIDDVDSLEDRKEKLKEDLQRFIDEL